MGTEASISIMSGAKRPTYKTIYVSCDGYPYDDKGIGNILLRYYNKEEDVIKLISMGNAYNIGKVLDYPTSEFWIRDIRADDAYINYNKPVIAKSRKKFEENCGEPYNYLFASGKWYIRGAWGGKDSWIPLTIIDPYKEVSEMTDTEKLKLLIEYIKKVDSEFMEHDATVDILEFIEKRGLNS